MDLQLIFLSLYSALLTALFEDKKEIIMSIKITKFLILLGKIVEIKDNENLRIFKYPPFQRHTF